MRDWHYLAPWKEHLIDLKLGGNRIKSNMLVLPILCIMKFFILSTATYSFSGGLEESIFKPGKLKPIDSVLKVKIGDPAPNFSLTAVSGQKVSLNQYAGKKNVVLSFVPAAWTPVCSSQWQDFMKRKDAFQKSDTVLLGITVDNAPTLYAWTKQMGNRWFPVLSDFWPHGAVADLYWVLRSDGTSERAIFIIDKQGIIRYVEVCEDIDEQPDNEDLFDVLEQLEPQAAAVYEAAMPPPAPEPEGEVILYCTPWCGACRRARNYLDELGVEYAEVNISQDRAAASRVRSWANGNETTPTFYVNGTIIVNFDKVRLDEAFGVG
jgi:peroxiredoxin (alkyl hydroperoxide reductase subunit C)